MTDDECEPAEDSCRALPSVSNAPPACEVILDHALRVVRAVCQRPGIPSEPVARMRDEENEPLRAGHDDPVR